jgi:hypothetical protein
MLTATVLPSGSLKVTADNATRSEIAESLRAGQCYWAVMADIFESYSCNGSYTPFDASDANPFVGLTSAPCIAEAMATEDNGNNEILGELWWYPNYMIRDPLDELKNRGATVFDRAPR